MKNENALSIFRPYRAGRPVDVFLGLKPQAKSFCPFGAMAFRLGFNLTSGSRL